MTVRPGPYVLFVDDGSAVGFVTSLSYPASDQKPRENARAFESGKFPGYLLVGGNGPALREHSYARAEDLIGGFLKNNASGYAAVFALTKCAECGDELHVNANAPSDKPDLCITCGGRPQPTSKDPTPMIKSSRNKSKPKKDDPVFDVASSMKSEASDANAPIERGRFREKLPSPINEMIAMQASNELAGVIVERAAWLERRKLENAKAREKRAHYDEQIEELGAKINKRTEMRDVECVEYLDPVKKEIFIVRKDTGETVTRRPAEDDDMQEVLLDGTGKPIVEPGGKKKKGGKPEPEPPFGAPVASAKQVDALLDGLGEP